jgi:hypothetical protein
VIGRRRIEGRALAGGGRQGDAQSTSASQSQARAPEGSVPLAASNAAKAEIVEVGPSGVPVWDGWVCRASDSIDPRLGGYRPRPRWPAESLCYAAVALAPPRRLRDVNKNGRSAG